MFPKIRTLIDRVISHPAGVGVERRRIAWEAARGGARTKPFEAHVSDDHVFDLAVTAALSAGALRLERGLRAIDEA